MDIKKFKKKDRWGGSVEYEFNVPPMNPQMSQGGEMGVPPMGQEQAANPQGHPGGPKGTDTVPAWLSPGEFVIDKDSTDKYRPLLEKINNEEGQGPPQMNMGGQVPQYRANGGDVFGQMGDFDGTQWIKNDPSLLDSVRQVESGGNNNAVSQAGAAGPYQIMPRTAQGPGFGTDAITQQQRFDPEASRKFSGQYLSGLQNANPTALPGEVLQRYNVGNAGYDRHMRRGTLPQETQQYADKVFKEQERRSNKVNDALADPKNTDETILPGTEKYEQLKKTKAEMEAPSGFSNASAQGVPQMGAQGEPPRGNAGYNEVGGGTGWRSEPEGWEAPPKPQYGGAPSTAEGQAMLANQRPDAPNYEGSDDSYENRFGPMLEARGMGATGSSQADIDAQLAGVMPQEVPVVGDNFDPTGGGSGYDQAIPQPQQQSYNFKDFREKALGDARHDVDMEDVADREEATMDAQADKVQAKERETRQIAAQGFDQKPDNELGEIIADPKAHKGAKALAKAELDNRAEPVATPGESGDAGGGTGAEYDARAIPKNPRESKEAEEKARMETDDKEVASTAAELNAPDGVAKAIKALKTKDGQVMMPDNKGGTAPIPKEVQSSLVEEAKGFWGDIGIGRAEIAKFILGYAGSRLAGASHGQAMSFGANLGLKAMEGRERSEAAAKLRAENRGYKKEDDAERKEERKLEGAYAKAQTNSKMYKPSHMSKIIDAYAAGNRGNIDKLLNDRSGFTAKAAAESKGVNFKKEVTYTNPKKSQAFDEGEVFHPIEGSKMVYSSSRGVVDPAKEGLKKGNSKDTRQGRRDNFRKNMKSKLTAISAGASKKGKSDLLFNAAYGADEAIIWAEGKPGISLDDPVYQRSVGLAMEKMWADEADPKALGHYLEEEYTKQSTLTMLGSGASKEASGTFYDKITAKAGGTDKVPEFYRQLQEDWKDKAKTWKPDGKIPKGSTPFLEWSKTVL